MTSFKSAPLVQLGSSDLNVTPICLGTMIFGEQVDEATSFSIMDRALELGINFFDTAEMYAVPPRPGTYNATETIIGNWFAKRPDARKKLVLATKVAGPARGMNWIRNGEADLTEQMMLDACDASLKRLKTDVIDLYQIHWPSRHVPAFGMLSYDPSKDTQVTPILAQLQALDKLVKAGKVRAVGLSNETPYGVHEFVSLAEQHGLTKIATVQNPYCLSPPANSAGAAQMPWLPPAATTPWPSPTVCRRPKWRWRFATPNGKLPAPSLGCARWRSWTSVWTRTARLCHPSFWPRLTKFAGRCVTLASDGEILAGKLLIDPLNRWPKKTTFQRHPPPSF